MSRTVWNCWVVKPRLAARYLRSPGSLGVLDAGTLCGGMRFGLSLGGREGDQRVPHRLLDQVIVAPLNVMPLMTVLDDHAPAHELANGFDYVVIVAAKPINPTNDKNVASPTYQLADGLQGGPRAAC